MSTFKDRLAEEQFELSAKIDKLEIFTDNQIFRNLDEENRKLLVNQLFAMKMYNEVLLQRIELLNKDKL